MESVTDHLERNIIRYGTITKTKKNNRLVRSLYFSYSKTIDFRKSAYGYLADNVCISIDCTIINPKNVFLYSGDVISNCFISALNAKFTMKKGCAVAAFPITSSFSAILRG